MTSATRAFSALMAASLIASLSSVPFAARAGERRADSGLGPSGRVFWFIVISFELVASALAIAAGLWAGKSVDLGAPLILRVFEGDPSGLSELWQGLPLAVMLGFETGVAVGLLHILLRRMTPAASNSPAGFPVWERLLASIAAGIREEVWFRLGLMTCLVWAIAGILGTQHKNAEVFWGANLLIALGFGITHVAQARALHGLTASYFAFILLLNGIASLAFGWVYYRQGLLVAIIAHSCTDLVLQLAVAPVAQRMGRRDSS